MSVSNFTSMRRGWDAFMDGKSMKELPGKTGSSERMYGEMGWELASIRASRKDDQFGRDSAFNPSAKRGLDVS